MWRPRIVIYEHVTRFNHPIHIIIITFPLDGHSSVGFLPLNTSTLYNMSEVTCWDTHSILLYILRWTFNRIFRISDRSMIIKRWGRQPIILATFSQNCMKLKDIWTERGPRFLHPVGSVNVSVFLFLPDTSFRCHFLFSSEKFIPIPLQIPFWFSLRHSEDSSPKVWHAQWQLWVYMCKILYATPPPSSFWIRHWVICTSCSVWVQRLCYLITMSDK